MNRSGDTVYQLHLHLLGIEPQVWRRIVVPGSVSLWKLHRIFQVTMGWHFSHLHQFIVGDYYQGIHYGEPDPEDEDEMPMQDHRRALLRKIAPRKGSTFLYEYDFGDSWKHAVTVEQIEPRTPDSIVPWCMEGARACPPEDCGGTGGYQHLLEVLGNRQHSEYRWLREWADHFEPEVFSVPQVNSALALLISLDASAR